MEGVLVGMTFPRRLDVLRAGLHRTNQRGISWYQQRDGTKVGDAIVLHGGYEDDEDHWDWIRYTGASANEDKDSTGRLLRSQSWSYEDNAALHLSYEQGIWVRVIRGYKGDPRYSPTNCYRYDGLYRVTEVRTATSRRPAPDGSPIDICQFDLRRLPERYQVQDAAQRHLLEAWDKLDKGEAPQNAATLEESTLSDAETFCEPGDEKFPTSREERVRRLIRDTAVARRIKQLYEGQCQLCGLRLVGPDGRPYGEGAHIKPLGRPHNGPDVEPNLLCLCPNCHVRLDLGAVLISDDHTVIVRADLAGAQLLPRLLVKDGHRIHPEYLHYHRTYWTQQR